MKKIKNVPPQNAFYVSNIVCDAIIKDIKELKKGFTTCDCYNCQCYREAYDNAVTIVERFVN